MIKANLFDRFLAGIAPDMAVRRLENRATFEMLSRGYDAAEDSRMRNHLAWNRALPLDEDNLIGSGDRQTIRLECRDLWRNNEIVRGAVDRFTAYAVWTGIYPQPQTSSTDWNKATASWWEQIYVPTADYRQLNGVDLISLQRLTISHRILDGDCGFILLDNGQLQAIEADRITTPQELNTDKNIVEGVRRTTTGLVLGYYVCNRNGQGTIDKTKYAYIRRENFVHCFNPIRIDQIRGISDLAPAINKLRDYDETDKYVLNKIKLDAMQQFKRKTESGLPNERMRGSYTKTGTDGKDAERVSKSEQGTTHWLRPNEEMDAFESKTPNGEYVPYLKHELQAIACCLNISYEILMLIFTEGSFSSQRAALIHNRHTFMEWHDWVSCSFMNRIYNWRIAKAINNRELPPAPVDTRGISEWWKKSWSLPHFDWVDPEKQARADKERYNMGTDSITSIVNSMGRDRDEVFAEKADDIGEAIRQSEIINKANPGANVTWREMIQTGVPGQITSPAPATPSEPAATPMKEESPDENA